MSEDLQLIVNGARYAGWKDQRVTRSLDQFAPSFSVGYTEKAAPDAKPVPIFGGDTCTIKIDGKLVVTGFTEEVRKTQSVGQIGASISGFGTTADLVACSASHKGGQWLGATVTSIVTDICKPFGIKVRADAPVGAKLTRFALDEGETAYDAIKRAAAMRALLVVTDPDGTVVLTRAGAARSATTLRYGVNVKSSELVDNVRDLFSSYTIKTQAAGSDLLSGAPAYALKVTVDDTRIKRYRPTTILADTEDSKKELKDRATWERNTRFGAARRYSCTIQGWYDDDKNLWAPNTLVRVVDDSYGLDDTLLIVTAQLTRSIDEGTIASLELTRKEAYDLVELPPKRPKGSGLGDDL